MNLENIVALAEMLVVTGFEQNVAKKLLRQICFRPASFVLSERFVKEGGWLRCNIYLEKEGELYGCRYYDASFLKAIAIPELVIQSVNIRELDQQMDGIDWKLEEERLDFDRSNELSWQTERQIENAISELSKLSVSPDGKYFADYLKLKHWSDIDKLPAGNNVNAIRSKFEVSQRFYFFDGKGISVEEAYRFLMNRWLEKKLNERAKLKSENGAHSGGRSDAGTDKRVIEKKRKASVKKTKDRV